MFRLRREKKLATASIVLFVVFFMYQSIHDGVLQTDKAYVNSYKSYSESPSSNSNSRSIICNNPASSTNETKFTIHDEANLVNCPFSQNKLWYDKRLMKTEDLPLQKYTAETKTILVWTYNWLHMPK